MQDPPSAAAFRLAAFVGLILLVSLVAWSGVLRKLLAGKPLIPYAARRAPPWGMGDACVIVGAWFFFMVLFSGLVRSFGDNATAAADALIETEPTTAQIRNLLLAVLAANLVTLLVAAIWLRLRGATNEICFPGPFLVDDIMLGARGFAVAAAPIYGLQMILTQYFPSKHPAIDLLVREANPATVALVVISAAVVAPLVEEFLFRLVLQGALEGLELRILGARACTSEKAPGIVSIPANAERASTEATNPFAPYASPEGLDDDLREKRLAATATDGDLITALPTGSLGGLKAGVWPIVASSSFFALLHLGHGPDPIPLAIFAAILGYVYRQTHRLTPSIVTHLLLNSCSLVIFWLQPS